MRVWPAFIRSLVLLLLPALGLAQPAVNVGSKRFTESYILGEIATRAVRQAGEAQAVHRQGLGNTAILFAALKAGSIDLYPEYTGTIAFELLGLSSVPDAAQLRRLLAGHGLAAEIRLGFSNGYALAMREERAAALGITRISDLARHPGLTVALSQEFLNRRDGWPALRVAYGLKFEDARGLDHGLAYEALAQGLVDVVDSYSTDAKLQRYGLRVLLDDRQFFPAYEAVLIHRADLPERYPHSWRALRALDGTVPAARMTAMNAAAELSGASFTRIAEDFLAGRPAPGGAYEERSLLTSLFAPDLARLTLEHLGLVLASLVLGVTVGVPLGIAAQGSRAARPWILGAAGVLQTIPSLALLAFLIAALDRIGTAPAVLALFLYSLLPIVRNTETGLDGVPGALRESAMALGLTPGQRLGLIELPLASRTILAGVKTSAVINVGTATIAAFIGAGGYGERIVSGLAVNDHVLLLAGALPAAALALLIQGLFEWLDRRLDRPAGREVDPGARRA